MNYLFFDCEFSNSFNSIEKICEIGYVITDQNFKVLISKDILVNPGKDGRFYLKGRNGHSDCQLSHTEKEYYAAPMYPNFYGMLKNLFLKKDTIVFGYAVEYDLKAIDNNNRRYDLKPFNIKAYDIQKIYKHFKNATPTTKTSLDFAAEELVNPKEMKGFVKHNPTCDALASMLVLKALTKKMKMPLTDILGQHKDCKFSLMEESQKRREKEKKAKEDQERLAFFKTLYNKKVFNCLALPLKGKAFYFSNGMMRNTEQMVKEARVIYSNGGIIRRFTSKIDYILCLNNDDLDKVKKTKYFARKNTPAILIDDVKNMIAEGL